MLKFVQRLIFSPFGPKHVAWCKQSNVLQ